MSEMNEKEETLSLLQDIHRNAAMGEYGTRLLMEKAGDYDLLGVLREYEKRYAALKDSAANKLRVRNEAPIEAGPLQNSMLFFGVQLNSLLDKTSSHIAEMLIEGSTMGIVKGEKSKKRNPHADTDSQNLQEKLIRLEQDFIDALKHYLK